jgi:hypothetical protein
LAYQYAVIDGKQRLEAIIDFLSDKLELPTDFEFFEEPNVRAGGLGLRQLKERYPDLANRFLNYELSIVSVMTDSDYLIEEMFQRLNESAALNAAEKRNSVMGATREAANTLSQHVLLVSRSPIRDLRYKYRELGAKFLAIEHQLDTKNSISDTKADTLYDLFKATQGASPEITAAQMEGYRSNAEETLGRMVPVFEGSDQLLASIGTVVVYYLIFRNAGVAELIDRSKLQRFEELRRPASRINEGDPQYARGANVRFREYNGLVQSSNDGGALQRRANILTAYASAPTEADGLRALDELGA